MDFLCSLIHQRLFCTSSGVGSSSLISSIYSCFVHHLQWNSSCISPISSCFVYHLGWLVLHWFDPSTVVSCIIWLGFFYLSRPSTVVLCIIWYGKSFIGLIHQQLLSTSSGIYSFSFRIREQLFVHHLIWIFLHWPVPSIVVSCIILYGLLHLSHTSTVILYVIWYAKIFVGLIQQQLFRTISDMNSFIPIDQQLFVHHLVWVVLHCSHPSTVVLYIIWYGFLYLCRPSTVVFYIIWCG